MMKHFFCNVSFWSELFVDVLQVQVNIFERTNMVIFLLSLHLENDLILSNLKTGPERCWGTVKMTLECQSLNYTT